jgi:hypothetical protein
MLKSKIDLCGETKKTLDLGSACFKAIHRGGAAAVQATVVVGAQSVPSVSDCEEKSRDLCLHKDRL